MEQLLLHGREQQRTSDGDGDDTRIHSASSERPHRDGAKGSTGTPGNTGCDRRGGPAVLVAAAASGSAPSAKEPRPAATSTIRSGNTGAPRGPSDRSRRASAVAASGTEPHRGADARTTGGDAG